MEIRVEENLQRIDKFLANELEILLAISKALLPTSNSFLLPSKNVIIIFFLLKIKNLYITIYIVL